MPREGHGSRNADYGTTGLVNNGHAPRGAWE